MTEFLIETYAPHESPCGLAARVEELALPAERASEADAEVRLLGLVFLPAEETCFYLYQAPSADAVRAALTRVGLAFDQLTEAVLIMPGQLFAPGENVPTHRAEVKEHRTEPPTVSPPGTRSEPKPHAPPTRAQYDVPTR